MTLYDTAVSGDFEAVKRMIESDVSRVNEKDKWGFTALHGLAEEEHLEIMKYLLSKGANPNAKNDEGVTPMHLCAWPDNFKILIEAGGDIEIRDNEGNRPIDIQTSEPDREDVVDYLIKLGSAPPA